MTTVSVIMATFNPTRRIERAISSVISQTSSSWELIIVDDASTEDVLGYVTPFLVDKRISYRRMDRNGGPACARNVGIYHSVGEWIAVLDDDDSWDNTRLEYLLRDEITASADLIYDNLMGFDDHANVNTGPIFRSLPKSLTIRDILLEQYEGLHNLGYLKPIIRKAILEKHSIRYNEALRGGEDLLLLLDVVAHGARTAPVRRSLYIYTTQVGSLSKRRSSSTRSVPQDRLIGEALLSFGDHCILKGNHDSIASLKGRAEAFFSSTHISEFRHARYTGQYLALVLILVSKRTVRRHFVNKALERALALIRRAVPTKQNV